MNSCSQILPIGNTSSQSFNRRFLPRRNSKARDSHERVRQLLLQSGRCLRHRQQSLVLAWRVFLMFYEAIPPQVWSEAAPKKSSSQGFGGISLVESCFLKHTTFEDILCFWGATRLQHLIYKHKQTNITH